MHFRYLANIFLFFCGTLMQARGQDASAFLGSKKPYVPLDSVNTPAPEGYQPFFVNHLSRHGARHLTNLKDIARLNRFLQQASQSGWLTAEGQRLKSRVNGLYKVEKQFTPGTLSQLGQEEQLGIGQRMRSHFPQIFQQGDHCYTVVTSPEQRTVQSAKNFIRGLLPVKADRSCLKWKKNDSIALRFFKVSPGYLDYQKNGDWKTKIRQLQQSDSLKWVTNSIMNRFFVPAFNSNQLQGKTAGITPVTLVSLLYSAGSAVDGLNGEIVNAGWAPDSLAILDLFTPNELHQLALIDGAKYFMVKGPGDDPNGIQVRASVPLMVDFLKSSDQLAKANKKTALLRFAHAETVAPIAALMELEGAATPEENIFDYEKAWNISQVICYSANIQWIFYQKQQSPLLLKILYNEKAVHIPVDSSLFPYYKWEDVRRFYVDKLKKFNVNKRDDMYRYLMQLK